MYLGNKRTNKAWKVIKGMRNQNKDTSNINHIEIQEWKKYYEQLLTKRRT